MKYKTVRQRRAIYVKALKYFQYKPDYLCIIIGALAKGHFPGKPWPDDYPELWPEFSGFEPIEEHFYGWFGDPHSDKGIATRIDVIEAAILICDLIINSEK